MKEEIKTILDTEQILKEAEYKDGRIILTQNHLVWIKKKKVDDTVIPLKNIEDVEKTMKWGLGLSLKVTYKEGNETKEAYFPFRKGTFTPMEKDVEEWITLLKTGEEAEIFSNIVYVMGHAAYGEKAKGQIILTSQKLIFESKTVNFEIPLEKIESLNIQTVSEISRISTLLIGPLWSMGLPQKSKLLIIQYEDEIGMKQTPLFDFPLDAGDKKKSKLMKGIYERIKALKTK